MRALRIFLLLTILAASFSSTIPAQSYVALRQFEEFENERQHPGPTHQAIMQVEVPLVWRLYWLVLIDVRGAPSDEVAGHSTPVIGDFGGGVLLKLGHWRLTYFGSSQHCFDRECEKGEARRTYNAVEVRVNFNPE